MFKRFKILAEESGRVVPEVGEEATFRIISEDAGTLPDDVEELKVTITATDPKWGPNPRWGKEKVTRIEGFTEYGDETRAVLGYHVIGVATRKYIGRIEIEIDES